MQETELFLPLKTNQKTHKQTKSKMSWAEAPPLSLPLSFHVASEEPSITVRYKTHDWVVGFYFTALCSG